MKKVAIIGTQGVPANYGGFETLVENIIGENCSNDIQYTVFCSGKDMPTRIKEHKGAELKYVGLRANGVQSIPYDIISMMRSIRGYDKRNVDFYKQPWSFRHLSADICEELNLVYGYAYGFELGEKKEVYFTNLADSKMYTVPIDTVDHGTFRSLCEDPCIVGAHIADAGSYQAYVMRVYESHD